jgi:molybdate transport system substrate-binding protein
MNKRRILALIGTVVASLLVATALPTIHPSPVTAQSNTTLLVSAAASLKEALEEIKPRSRWRSLS